MHNAFADTKPKKSRHWRPWPSRVHNIDLCFPCFPVLFDQDTHTTVQQPFVWDFQVCQYQKKHSPTSNILNELHPSITIHVASSLFSLHAWQSFSTTYFQVLFGLLLGLRLHTPYISSPNYYLPFATHAHAQPRHSSQNQVDRWYTAATLSTRWYQIFIRLLPFKCTAKTMLCIFLVSLVNYRSMEMV